MLLTNNEIDLGKSFEKLKEGLREAYQISASQKPGCHARALGFLESTVKLHLVRCTDMDMKDVQDYIEKSDPDDVTGVL